MSQRRAHPSSPARCYKEEQGVGALHGCTRQHKTVQATWVLPEVGVGHRAKVVAMEETVEDTCGSWSGQHLLRVATGGGLGMSHCPAMGLSHRAGSPAPPPPAAPTKDLLSTALHPLPAPRLSLVLVVGIGTSGLPPGAWPGPGCLPHVWKVTIQGLAFPERGLPGPESLPR